MNHTKIINKLIDKFNYKTYLEIGIYNPNDNYNSINIEYKESCDVNDNYNMVTYHMTSDKMFEIMPSDKMYDIIFIDAMHDEQYVDRDINNSLKHLNKNGLICLHDTIPGSKSMAEKKDKYPGYAWNGDVYKSILKIYDTGLKYVTVNNNDYGLTIIFNNGIDSIPLDMICKYKYDDIFIDNNKNHITELGKKLLHVIEIDNELLT